MFNLNYPEELALIVENFCKLYSPCFFCVCKSSEVDFLGALISTWMLHGKSYFKMHLPRLMMMGTSENQLQTSF